MIPSPLQGPPSVSVVLDGSGNGIAQLGPTRVREHWQVAKASVKVSTQTIEATCSGYVGPAALDPYFYSATFTGSTGDTMNVDEDIQAGSFVWAKWVGGDPGAIATLVVTGTYTIGPPPS
jgi:hypothetical protein